MGAAIFEQSLTIHPSAPSLFRTCMQRTRGRGREGYHVYSYNSILFVRAACYVRLFRRPYTSNAPARLACPRFRRRSVSFSHKARNWKGKMPPAVHTHKGKQGKSFCAFCRDVRTRVCSVRVASINRRRTNLVWNLELCLFTYLATLFILSTFLIFFQL